jgi:hypothetical protein
MRLAPTVHPSDPSDDRTLLGVSAAHFARSAVVWWRNVEVYFLPFLNPAPASRDNPSLPYRQVGHRRRG